MKENKDTSLKLPNGLDFSPSYSNILINVLTIINAFPGDKTMIIEKVASKIYKNTKNPKDLAKNCLNGMKSYSLQVDYKLTDFGSYLLSLKSNKEQLYNEFGKHLLWKCQGMELCQSIKDITQSDGWSGDKKVQLAKHLGEFYQIETTPNGKAVPTLKRWLTEVKIIDGKSWSVNWNKVDLLLDGKTEVIDTLSELNNDEYIYLKALINLAGENSFPEKDKFINSNDVRRFVKDVYKIELSETNLPKEVLKSLEKKGLIELKYCGSKQSHGGSRYVVCPTAKVVSDDISDYINRLNYDSKDKLKLKQGLKKSYKEILRMCNSADIYKKGYGLELLGLKILKSIGLTAINIRGREGKTARAEVDLLFLDERGTYATWQVQCKNTKSVNSDRIYREIGMAHVAKYNVVCIITTGVFTGDAIRVANLANRNTSQSIILISGDDINGIVQGKIPAYILFQNKLKDVHILKNDISYVEKQIHLL